jgi:hypothetical protein
MFNLSRKIGVFAVAVAAIGWTTSANAGVVAHYSFDATVTADDSGNGNTLTAGGGGPGLVGGQFGTAADFNGVSFLYLNGASKNSAFNVLTGNFALSYWYKSDLTSFGQLAGKSSSDLDLGYASTLGGTYVGGDLNDTTAGGVGILRPASDDDTYQHIVFQKIGSLLQLYVNGSIVGASTTPGGLDAVNNAFAIGTRNIALTGTENFNGASQKFDGQIDEVWVFEDALTPEEIINLKKFNDIGGQQVPEPGTIALIGLGLFGLRYGMRRRRN